MLAQISTLSNRAASCRMKHVQHHRNYDRCSRYKTRHAHFGLKMDSWANEGGENNGTEAPKQTETVELCSCTDGILVYVREVCVIAALTA